MKRKFSVTYGITTPELAEHGDYAVTGFILEDAPLRDCVEELFRTRTSLAGGIVGCEAQEGHITVDNGAEFETGAYETRTLHTRHISVSSQKRLAKLLGVNWCF